MTIEFIPKEKAMSLVSFIPSANPSLLASPPEAEFALLSEEKGFSTSFVLVSVLGDSILFISDESKREAVEKFLKKERGEENDASK